MARDATAHIGHISLRRLACSAASFRQVTTETPVRPGSLPSDLDFSVSVRSQAKRKDHIKVELSVVLHSNIEVGQPYDVDVTYWGDFQLGSLPEGLTPKLFAEQNAVAILFPYVREAITSFTGRGTAGPVLVPPINIVSLLTQARALDRENELPTPDKDSRTTVDTSS